MILLNGEMMAGEAARVSPLGEGFQLGAGVFTTVRVRGRRAEFLDEHAERLSGDARAVGLRAASEPGVLRERCAACIAANRIVEGGIKVVWFADVGGGTSELILERPHNYGPEASARGVRLMTMTCGSRENRMLSRHKTLNYFEHMQAKRAAVTAGFDEALWIDEHGRVLEGATTNVFAVFRDHVITPDERAGLLPGIARRVVLRLAATRPVKAEELTRERLEKAEEVFVTNALMGVMPVRTWDGRTWDVSRGEVTRMFAAAWARAALGTLP